MSHERVWRTEQPLDLRATLAPLRRGHGDPALHEDGDGALWRASHTPDGPGTLRLAVRPGERAVHASGYGPGACWLLDTLPVLLGADDDDTGFVPRHPALVRAVAQRGGVRIGYTGRVFEALVPAVLEQKVVGAEARRAWRRLLRWFGTPAPGPRPGLYAPPPAVTWARIPSWDWHRAGVEAIRARTIVAVARVADRLEGHDTAETDRRLRSLPGIGVWTSAEVRQRSHGDPDAVSVGDYHLPALVGWALAGHRVDDAGMLALLAPYVGHRYRVTRLIEFAGTRPPRRGPRLAPRDYRAI